MRFAVLLLCIALAVPLTSAQWGAGGPVPFDPFEVYQALGTYGNKVNALAQYSPITCGGPANTTGLAAAAHDLVYSTFSGKYLKYYRTEGPAPLNFTIGGDFSLFGPVVHLTDTTVFRNQLVQFYSFIFSIIFSQPNHWLYSTPTIVFNPSNPQFNHAATATVTVENESRAFTCSGTTRNFQVYMDTFTHVFCYEDNPGVANDGWKICGFFELNKGIFTQPASQFTQLWPL